MFSFLKSIFSSKPKADIGDLIKQGATIIDVRTRGEFEQGHLKGSINIPLKNLTENMAKIRKDKPVITCCASGARSAAAKSILRSNGFVEVYNGGAWTKLRKFM